MYLAPSSWRRGRWAWPQVGAGRNLIDAVIFPLIISLGGGAANEIQLILQFVFSPAVPSVW
jgi:hypothetical protein